MTISAVGVLAQRKIVHVLSHYDVNLGSLTYKCYGEIKILRLQNVTQFKKWNSDKECSNPLSLLHKLLCYPSKYLFLNEVSFLGG